MGGKWRRLKRVVGRIEGACRKTRRSGRPGGAKSWSSIVGEFRVGMLSILNTRPKTVRVSWWN